MKIQLLKFNQFLTNPGNKLPAKFNFYEIPIFFALILYLIIIADPISSYLGATGHTKSFKTLSIIKLFSSIIAAPIIEELIFRTHLDRSKNQVWSIPFGVLILLILINQWGPLFVLGSFILVILVFVYTYNSIYAFILRKFKFTFFVTALIFGLAHFPVIDASSIMGKLVIILVALFPLGIYLGYIRVRFGLIYSMLAHSLYNLITLMINTFLY